MRGMIPPNYFEIPMSETDNSASVPPETVRELLARPQAGGQVRARGWLRTARHSKNVSFLEIYDGSTPAGLQVVAAPNLPNYESVIRHLGAGSAVAASGELVASPGEGQKYELQATAVELIGPAAEDYPLQKKRHSFEFLRTLGHLRLRTNTFGSVMRVRNAAAKAIHDFFQERGFIYLHAPIITASDCEGAGEMFRVSTLDPQTPPRTPEGQVDFSQDFFGRESYLTVSGQLEGEIGALALGKIYTFGPTFRAENSNTSRHLAEFWMIEPEVAFCDLNDLCALTEDFLHYIFSAVLNRCLPDLEFFDQRIQPGLLETLRQMAETPFARLTYTEAVEILSRSGREFEFAPHWGMDMQSEHERYLAEEHCRRPVIVTDYPAQIKAFYMYRNDDGQTVRAMDVLAPRVGEIIGGSQREDRLEVLRQRLAECGLDEQKYWWYLDLRRWGSAPHSGFGLGFERAVQFMTGMANIRDVIPFPRTPGSADF